MLIIFDLDDTLIDTSGSISNVRLETAFHRMIEQGVRFSNPTLALETLMRLNNSAISSRDALIEFSEMHDVPKKIYEVSVKEIYEDPNFDMPIYPLDEALEVLEILRFSHQLALVTAGTADLQLTKLKKAGIDSSYFSKIAVCPSAQKKIHYEQIIEELGYMPSQVVVVGDRIAADLTPAKELGCKTVQMLWGRGRVSQGAKADVDYTITRLSGLKDILMGLNKR